MANSDFLLGKNLNFKKTRESSLQTWINELKVVSKTGKDHGVQVAPRSGVSNTNTTDSVLCVVAVYQNCYAVQNLSV